MANNILHNTLTKNDLHEVKGADSAFKGTFLMSNGDGTTTFTDITTLITGSNIKITTLDVTSTLSYTLEKSENTFCIILPNTSDNITITKVIETKTLEEIDYEYELTVDDIEYNLNESSVSDELVFNVDVNNKDEDGETIVESKEYKVPYSFFKYNLEKTPITKNYTIPLKSYKEVVTKESKEIELPIYYRLNGGISDEYVVYSISKEYVTEEGIVSSPNVNTYKWKDGYDDDDNKPSDADNYTDEESPYKEIDVEATILKITIIEDLG